LLALCAATVAVFLVLAGFPWYQSMLEAWVCRQIRPAGVSVQTHRRTLLYDRGPYSTGGLRALPVPAEGLVVRKRFALAGVTLPQTTPVLRVPVVLDKGTRFEAQLSVGGTTYDTTTMSVETDRGRQRLVFRLTGLTRADAVAEVTMAIKPLGGQIAVLVDSLRWYGRSEYLAGAASLALPAEAAFELEWLTAEPSAPPSP
jgi:hypothetical protein